MNKKTYCIALSLLLLGWTIAASADPQRGEMLYQNHCSECHIDTVHFREQRKAETLDNLRTWVIRWETELGLGWAGSDIDDVTKYLNRRFYRFAEAP
jgi:mono/diheme cytochrome c family protein